MSVIHRRMCDLRQILLFLTSVALVLMLATSCDNANPSSKKDDNNPEDPNVIPATIKDIDGNVYTTVKIGNQVWTVENLKVTKYNDGSAISFDTSSATWRGATTPKYCFYKNNNNADSIKKYGVLYNWHVVNPANPKKIAPAGWHVPTDAEWDTLETYLIVNGYNWDATTTGNKIAKSMAANTDWKSDFELGSIGNDLSINNRSGFSALPGGCRSFGGGYYDQSTFGGWWSSTELNAVYAHCRFFYYKEDLLSRRSDLKTFGFSVRLVRD